jgi:hypothetical protein
MPHCPVGLPPVVRELGPPILHTSMLCCFIYLVVHLIRDVGPSTHVHANTSIKRKYTLHLMVRTAWEGALSLLTKTEGQGAPGVG